jgi:hypothetical protein
MFLAELKVSKLNKFRDVIVNMEYNNTLGFRGSSSDINTHPLTQDKIVLTQVRDKEQPLQENQPTSGLSECTQE